MVDPEERFENGQDLQQLVDKLLEESKARGCLVEKAYELGPGRTVDVSTEVGSQLASELQRLGMDPFRASRDHQRSCPRRLSEEWGSAFEMFELVLLCADQLHVDFHTRCAPAPGEATWKFDAFSQLQARACAIGREIHDNLDLGYVQVAAARWRTLHELAVEARLLQMNDEAVAERYLSHETIAECKAVKAYEKNCTSLGLKPLPPDVVRKLDAEYKALRERFGKDFTGDYGWAADTVEGRPTFVDLEKAVGLAHLRYWYDFMCKVTHGGARGLSLASLESRARASSAALALVETGLPFVAHGSLVSLFQISTAVASLRPNVLPMSVLVQAMARLLDDAAVAFASINDEWFKEGQTGRNRAEAP